MAATQKTAPVAPGNIVSRLRFSPLDWLLAATVAAVVAYLLKAPALLVFVLACLGLIPLAGQMGSATEILAARAGPKVGGLLNATLGNAAELIITLVAVNSGLLELVKASITGSILGNLLLVLGFSFLAGGLRHGTQRFSREAAGRYASMLVLAVVALCVPSVFHQYAAAADPARVEDLSLGVAGMMMVMYLLSLVFSLRGRSGVLPPAEEWPKEKKSVNPAGPIIRLALATAGVVLLSEILVGVVEPVVAASGISQFFLGIVLIPVIGNVAEHLVAVQMARRNNVELSLEVTLGSSLQIALFVAPLLVFLSLGFGHPLTLVFNPFEVVALIAGVAVTALISADGESNWLEGGVLLAVYTILALAFFMLPV